MNVLKALTVLVIGSLFPTEDIEVAEDNTVISNHNSSVISLDLSHDESLTDISFIRHFPNLVELNLEEDCYLGNNYKPICEIISLTKLNLSGMDITLLKPLKRLLSLQELNLSENQIKSISALTSLKLHTLNLSGNWRIKDLHLVGKITTLVNLDISSILSENDDMQQYYPSLDCLHPLIDLKCLNIRGNYALERISPLLYLPNLEKLNASVCRNIEDYAVINNLPFLKEITLLPDEYKKTGKLSSYIILILVDLNQNLMNPR